MHWNICDSWLLQEREQSLKPYYIALYLSVLLTAISQVMMKLAASSSLASIRQRLRLAAAYALLLVALGLNVYGLQSVPLSHMAFILPATFVMVPLFSMLFLGEKQGLRFWLGSGLIVAGALIFNLP